MELLKSIHGILYTSLAQVELPRRVVIKNFRLGATLRVFQLAATAFVVCLIVADSSWAKIVVPTTMRVIGAWDDTKHSEYILQDRTDLGREFCESPGRYDYAFGSDWLFESYSCSSPVAMAERLWEEGGDVLFAPSAFKETRYQQVPAGPGDGCAGIQEECAAGWERAGSVCKCITSSMHFVTGVEALGLAFEHEYSMSSSMSSNLLGTSQSSFQKSYQKCEQHGSVCAEQNPGEGETLDLKTVIGVASQDGTERLLGVFDAPSEIAISFAHILQEAGFSMDATELTGHPNELPCVTDAADREPCVQNPVIRQTGLSMDIHLHYSNRHARSALPCEECVKNHIGPVCKATITLEPSWQMRHKTDCDMLVEPADGVGSCRSRAYHGVEIRFTTSGSFGLLDPNHIIVTLGAGIVYLTIPLIIINLVATWLLGALSDVYRKADREELSMKGQLAGFVARMITAQAAYCQVTGADERVLTKEMLLERIQLCLENSGQQGLDEQETIHLAELAAQSFGAERGGSVHMHDFIQAVVGNEPINVREAVQLFDAQRRPGCLEWLFAPKPWQAHAEELFERNEEGLYEVARIRKAVLQQRAKLCRRAQRASSSPCEVVDAYEVQLPGSVNSGVGCAP